MFVGSAKDWPGGLNLTFAGLPRLLTSLRTALPILFGGWFVFVIIASFPGLLQRPIALRDGQETASFLDDFVVFHSAGKYALEAGGDIYEPAVISRLEAETTGQEPEKVVVLPFFNPPAALLAFWPLGLLPVGVAAAVWLTLSVAVAGVLFRMLAREIGLAADSTAFLFVLGTCASLPFYQAVMHGQMTFLLLGGFCLFCAGTLRPRGATFVLMGLVLLALKPIFLLFPLLFLAMRRQFHLLAAFVVVEGLLVVAAALAFGTSLPLDYVSMSLKALSWDEVNGISTYGMFGWTGFWRGVLGPEARELQSLLAFASSAATLAVTVQVFRCSRGQPLLALSAVVLASLLVSPHSYAQDLLLLSVPLLLLAASKSSRRSVAVAAVLTWFAFYVHFDVLDATGLGPANIGLILLGAWVLREATSSELVASRATGEPEAPFKILQFRRRPPFPSEAAGS